MASFNNSQVFGGFGILLQIFVKVKSLTEAYYTVVNTCILFVYGLGFSGVTVFTSEPL
jgi:hypothetical protein